MAKDHNKDITNPYLDGAIRYNERYGSAIRNAITAYLLAGLFAILSCVTTGYAIYQSTGNKVIPYVVEIDEEGKVFRIGEARATTVQDEYVIKSHLANQIKNMRTVSGDGTVQKNRIDEFYRNVLRGSPAIPKINDYFQDEANSPFKRAEYELVDVKIDSVIMLSKETVEIEWVEIVRDRQGRKVEDKKYKAVIQFGVKAGESEAELISNPLGIQITDIHWSEKAVKQTN